MLFFCSLNVYICWTSEEEEEKLCQIVDVPTRVSVTMNSIFLFLISLVFSCWVCHHCQVSLKLFLAHDVCLIFSSPFDPNRHSSLHSYSREIHYSILLSHPPGKKKGEF